MPKETFWIDWDSNIVCRDCESWLSSMGGSIDSEHADPETVSRLKKTPRIKERIDTRLDVPCHCGSLDAWEIVTATKLASQIWF